MPHVTFIHGISNKPEKDKLLRIWSNSLSTPIGSEFGLDLGAEGVTTSMIYWADVLYESPGKKIKESVHDFESLESMAKESDADPDMAWRSDLDGEELEFIEGLAKKFEIDLEIEDDFVSNDTGMTSLESVPLPWFIKRRLMKWLLRDVHHYMYNYSHSPRPGTTYMVQEEIRERTIRVLEAVKTDCHLVVAHSMGSIIIYDCLKRIPECPEIDGLITVGSPLGIDEVQHLFKPEWTRYDGYAEKVKNGWINVYDRYDPVTGFDGNISNDYKRSGKEVIEIINEQNSGAWRHNISNYFKQPRIRKALIELLNL